MHPFMTPMRDPSGELSSHVIILNGVRHILHVHLLFFAATPFHDGMRTPMRDRAWNPHSPMTPLRLVLVLVALYFV